MPLFSCFTPGGVFWQLESGRPGSGGYGGVAGATQSSSEMNPRRACPSPGAHSHAGGPEPGQGSVCTGKRGLRWDHHPKSMLTLEIPALYLIAICNGEDV